ncbi:MAG: hypothetical protein ACI93R_003281 [Flavobacteriales bacterium]|jgi:hypothetical protein
MQLRAILRSGSNNIAVINILEKVPAFLAAFSA